MVGGWTHSHKVANRTVGWSLNQRFERILDPTGDSGMTARKAKGSDRLFSNWTCHPTLDSRERDRLVTVIS